MRCTAGSPGPGVGFARLAGVLRRLRRSDRRVTGVEEISRSTPEEASSRGAGRCGTEKPEPAKQPPGLNRNRRLRPGAEAEPPRRLRPRPPNPSHLPEEEKADEVELQPLIGISATIAKRMDESLGVPTATSVRTVPAKLLEVNRRMINNQLGGSPRAGRSASPT